MTAAELVLVVVVQEALPGLHDIVVPEPVTWMPATVGWVIVLVAAVALTAGHLVRVHRKRLANRYRITALEELATIERVLEGTGPSGAALARLPALLKRVALTFTDRTRIASLTGEPWLAFLDEAYGGTGFSQGPGRELGRLAYAPQGQAEDKGASGVGNSTADLITLIRTWIETHDPRRVSQEIEHA